MNSYELHRAVMAYGESMRLVGVYRERMRSAATFTDMSRCYDLMRRAGDVSIVIHRRILNLAFTPPF